MKQTIGFCQFCDAFRDADRTGNFSHDGIRVLFDYFEEMESSTGEEMELDVIAICCDYSELHYTDCIREYRIDITDFEGETITDEDELIEIVRGYLEDSTCIVGENDGTFLFQVF